MQIGEILTFGSENPNCWVLYRRVYTGHRFIKITAAQQKAELIVILIHKTNTIPQYCIGSRAQCLNDEEGPNLIHQNNIVIILGIALRQIDGRP